MAAERSRVEVGFVARAHGIRGEICAVPHDPESTTLTEVSAVWIGGTRYDVAQARDTNKGVLLALAGLTDRTIAEGLRGKPVEVDRDELDLAEGDVLLTDLVGCKVQLRDGTPWGEIVGLDLGPQVRLVIHDGGVERLVPLVDELVPGIDLDARLVTVDPPEDFPEEQL
jgi:16S rRNA processing protein RimM